jgi:hypothetical protein
MLLIPIDNQFRFRAISQARKNNTFFAVKAVGERLGKGALFASCSELFYPRFHLDSDAIFIGADCYRLFYS